MPFACVRIIEPIVEPELCIPVTVRKGEFYGGGTWQAQNTSPNGQWRIIASDVGGVAIQQAGDTAWQRMPTDNTNAGRQVSGAVILDNGSFYTLVGNGDTAGKILAYGPGGTTVTQLHGNLAVRANSFTAGDTGARPRPVGYTLSHDPVNNLLYAATENGVFLCDLNTPANSRFIALNGESVRGIAHDSATTVSTFDPLYVATRTMGVVCIADPNGAATPTQIGNTTGDRFTRAEDLAYITPNSFLVAGHEEGVFRAFSGGFSTDITPSQAVGVATANGSPMRWTAVDVHPATGLAIVTGINPVDNTSWVYRTTVPAAQATADDWETVSHTPATLLTGTTQLQPPNRIIGGNIGTGGDNLTGGQSLAFDPNDPTGNTVRFLGTLTPAISTNLAAADNTAVTWATDAECLSLYSSVTGAVSQDGTLGLATADNNGFFFDQGDGMRVGVSGLGDANDMDTCGDIWVFAAAEAETSVEPNNGLYYGFGPGAPPTWQTTSWQSFDWNTAIQAVGLAGLPTMDPPRVLGSCCTDLGNGIYRVHWQADYAGIGYVDYNSLTDTWVNPVVVDTGLTDSQVQPNNANKPKHIKCADTGLVLVQHQQTGRIYRSLDNGESYTRITDIAGPTTLFNPAYLELDEAADCAIVSNSTGTYIISDVSTNPTTTQISAQGGYPVATDPTTGRTYLFKRQSGQIELLEFEDIKQANSLSDGCNVATEELSLYAGSLANDMFYHGGKLYVIYQGAGFNILDLN